MTDRDLRPNLFVVGAMRAGSTTLYVYLAEHPEVYMSPIKEPNFFSRSDGPEWMAGLRDSELCRYLEGTMPFQHAARVMSWDDYLLLFEGGPGYDVRGEASPAYLYSPSAPTEIARACPGAKAVVVLRPPIERARSHHRMDVAIGATRSSFADAVAPTGDPDPRHPYLDAGMYAERLERYIDVLGRERVRTYVFDDLVADPRAVLTDLAVFLGIDAGSFGPTEVRRNPSPQPRLRGVNALLHRTGMKGWIAKRLPRPLVDAGKRFYYGGQRSGRDPLDAALGELFRSDVQRVEEILGRDLSHWLVTPQGSAETGPER